MIKGFIKNSFVDYPGKVAATVFTGGCNFSCPFCHNGELVKSPGKIKSIETWEIIDFLEKRKGLIDGLVITGGEPTLWPGLRDFIVKIKSMGFSVKLDSNGYEPLVLEKLLQEGIIDYIAMDIKNSPEKYAQTAGLKTLDISRIIKSIQLIKESGISYEFRTTVMKEFHSKEDLIKIGEWLKGSEKYVLQNYNPKEGQVEDKIFTPFSKEELSEYKSLLSDYIQKVEIRN
ncbi:MAG: anaerobic ribonucleoside-triphosphate reductase activating protein [Eubacteriales bacterium]|nr:anaerobic ribonucleoside-triphosphate reductase activating protein [Eubacteriales bacterium]NCC81237.1 anaerobic ribonucleoside-triphosphate reductase activating protein [Clostridia bacterium]